MWEYRLVWTKQAPSWWGKIWQRGTALLQERGLPPDSRADTYLVLPGRADVGLNKKCLDLLRDAMLALPYDILDAQTKIGLYRQELQRDIDKWPDNKGPRQLARLAAYLTLICALAFIASAILFLSSL